MFDIGFSELFLVAVVALIVLGPERLPKAARFAGLWVRRARAQWYSVKAELENELADEELKRSLRQARDDLDDARATVAASGAAVREGFNVGPRDPLPEPGGPPKGDPDSGEPPAGDPDPGEPERRDPGVDAPVKEPPPAPAEPEPTPVPDDHDPRRR